MNIPQELRSESRWVVWREEKRNGKKTKVPYDPKTDAFAKSNDPSTWATFEQATQASDIFSAKGYNGSGFMLYNSNLTGVDFDGVIDDGVPEQYVLNIISQIGDPYCEITPSGTGMRVFIKGAQLPPGNRKFSAKKKGVEKYGAEIYSGAEGGRYLTITGDRYSGEGIPEIENIDVVYFLISKFADSHFRRLWMGDSSEYENDDSRVDLALLGLLGRTFSGEQEKMLRFFAASVPGHREKWVNRKDYRELTLNKALNSLTMSEKTWKKFVDQPRKIIEFKNELSEEQAAKRTAFDYVIEPLVDKDEFDGWFPLGSPSLVGGSSGSGKTTAVLNMLVAQKNRFPFFGHPTNGRPFLVLMMDRGKFSHVRTMRRLRFTDDEVSIKFIKACVDGEASQQIIDLIESTTPQPEVVFVEGIDMLVSDPNAMEIVMPFMYEMQQIAAHFHIALIGSTGAPKAKPREGYAAKRDMIFGSAVWTRMSETVVACQFPAGDDTAERRIMSILPRNAHAESYETEFKQGRVVPVTPEEVVKKPTEQESPRGKVQNAILKVLLDGPDFAGTIKSKLRELHGITGNKLVEEVSAEMVNRKLIFKRNTDGKWIWEKNKEACAEM